MPVEASSLAYDRQKTILDHERCERVEVTLGEPGRQATEPHADRELMP
jgi:hypothetical protein